MQRFWTVCGQHFLYRSAKSCPSWPTRSEPRVCFLSLNSAVRLRTRLSAAGVSPAAIVFSRNLFPSGKRRNWRLRRSHDAETARGVRRLAVNRCLFPFSRHQIPIPSNMVKASRRQVGAHPPRHRNLQASRWLIGEDGNVPSYLPVLRSERGRWWSRTTLPACC